MLENVRIILVNTSHTGNIGSAARAMKTMGLSQLVLVDQYNRPMDNQLPWRLVRRTFWLICVLYLHWRKPLLIVL